MKFKVPGNLPKSRTVFFAALGLSLLTINNLSAQENSDPTLLTVANENISKSTFEKVYRKNNSKEGTLDKKSLQEYLDLYINYKLKVKEAEELKLDSSFAFTAELQNYRKQLSQPYLSDKSVTEKLMKEAYERFKKDIRASHILIKVGSDALPKDSLVAYNRAMEAYNRIQKGEDFLVMAKEYSEDPSVKDNNGDLGFFTALQMVYPFESAVYTLEKNQVSRPIRTRFGYHIIKVTDSRAAVGELRCAHIMVKTPKTATAEENEKAKARIDELYKKLKAGEKFEDLASQYSDDQGSAKNGGILPWFGTGRMVPEFEAAAFKIKSNGEYTEPIKSSYGWHIIKRIEKKDLATFEEMQSELKSKIAKDSRSEVSKSSFVNKVKAEYKFKEFPEAKKEYFSRIDSTLLEGRWDIDKTEGLNKPLFQLSDVVYTQLMFTKFISEHQTKRRNADLQMVFNAIYDQYISEACIALKESRLDSEYPEFKALMQEYRDGILLFELTDRKVWSKAVKDTSGLKTFYESNKTKYMWNQRLDATIYTCAGEEMAKKVRKLLKKEDITTEKILETLNADAPLNVAIKEGKYLSGDNDIIDSIPWIKGITPNINKGKSVVFVNVKNVLQPQPKSLEEAKGLVTADFQETLEKEWIESLRRKYAVTVNKDILSQIK